MYTTLRNYIIFSMVCCIQYTSSAQLGCGYCSRGCCFLILSILLLYPFVIDPSCKVIQLYSSLPSISSSYLYLLTKLFLVYEQKYVQLSGPVLKKNLSWSRYLLFSFSPHCLAKGKDKKFSQIQRQTLHGKETNVNPPVRILNYHFKYSHADHFLLHHYMVERNIYSPSLSHCVFSLLQKSYSLLRLILEIKMTKFSPSV